MKDLDQLPFDTLVRISTFLSLSETQRLLLTNKVLYLIGFKPELWKHWFSLVSKHTLDALWFHHSMGRSFDDMTIHEIKELSREAVALSDIKHAQWKRVDYHSESERDKLYPMEAHTMSLLFDRYLVVTGGWSRSPNANQISFLDAWAIPHNILTIPTETLGNPAFRYGFSTLSYKGKLYVFGGCREGGYTGDCNDMYVVNIKLYKNRGKSSDRNEEIEIGYDLHDEQHLSLFRNAPIKYWDRVECTYSNNITSVSADSMPTERAYHGCSLAHFNDRDCMIVWGGLHASDVIGQLELYDLENNSWMATSWTGEEPSPRFGLSLMPVKNLNREHFGFDKIDNFIVSGGSDGNDLIRNGDELLDIHVLTIARGNRALGQLDSFVWSHLNAGVNMNMIPGRCHTAAAIEDCFILFGGGANNSNSTTIMKLQSETENDIFAGNGESSKSCGSSSFCGSNISNITIELSHPHFASETVPSIRTSSAATIIGRYMLVFGGWSNSLRELGDFWVLDLAPGNEISPRVILDKATPNYDFISELLKNQPQQYETESAEGERSYQFINSEGENTDPDNTDTSMFANPLFLQQVLALMGTNPGIDFTTAMQMLSTGAAVPQSNDQTNQYPPFHGMGQEEEEDPDNDDDNDNAAFNPLGSNYFW